MKRVKPSDDRNDMTRHISEISENSIKRVAVLGSTGSIGTQTLDIIATYPELFKAQVLAAGSNVDMLIDRKSVV